MKYIDTETTGIPVTVIDVQLRSGCICGKCYKNRDTTCICGIIYSSRGVSYCPACGRPPWCKE